MSILERTMQQHIFSWDFWNKNDVKCKINIKKTNPTPRSITHKNPIYISESFKKPRKPRKTKYKPPIYKRVSKFIVII